MNDQYLTISQYIECKSTLYDKIVAINNIILAMELKLAESVIQSGYVEMNIDDGQMKTKAVYRSMQDLAAGLQGLEVLKQRYVNRYNGRVTRLVGGNL
jgi:hypothetical protein